MQKNKRKADDCFSNKDQTDLALKIGRLVFGT